MRLSSTLSALLLLSCVPLLAESRNPADYPLRIHIFPHEQTTFYHSRMVDEAQGEGRANLFANDNVHGIDYSFECSGKVKPSLGFETYPAKWKKPNQELVVLLPVFGKANAYETCNFKTDVKATTYFFNRNGGLGTEPSADYKAWMLKHNYDPEHGKNTPTSSEPARTQPAAP